jgi:hypothetical protein
LSDHLTIVKGMCFLDWEGRNGGRDNVQICRCKYADVQMNTKRNLIGRISFAFLCILAAMPAGRLAVKLFSPKNIYVEKICSTDFRLYLSVSPRAGCVG